MLTEAELDYLTSKFQEKQEINYRRVLSYFLPPTNLFKCGNDLGRILANEEKDVSTRTCVVLPLATKPNSCFPGIKSYLQKQVKQDGPGGGHNAKGGLILTDFFCS